MCQTNSSYSHYVILHPTIKSVLMNVPRIHLHATTSISLIALLRHLVYVISSEWCRIIITARPIITSRGMIRGRLLHDRSRYLMARVRRTISFTVMLMELVVFDMHTVNNFMTTIRIIHQPMVIRTATLIHLGAIILIHAHPSLLDIAHTHQPLGTSTIEMEYASSMKINAVARLTMHVHPLMHRTSSVL